MTRMAEHAAETERDLEECAFDHFQELLAADPAYLEWCKLYETELEELPGT